MNQNIIAITKPPKHHFFGFHDIPAGNFNGDKLLCLEVDFINRPPKAEDFAGVGYVFEGNFVKLGNTNSFNFPQGARMQWLGNSDYFIVNNRYNSIFGCDLYDTTSNKLIDDFRFSCHHIHKNGKTAFSINYARLQRLGAYGYAGGVDSSRGELLPIKDGIMVGDLHTKKSEILISTYDIANFPDKLNTSPFGSHYLTHLLLNPSNTRLAFLHRYPLADGGEMTRLMTISIDGTDLRCIASGFLSHFDWKDDKTILIFGRANSSLDNIRGNPFFANPYIKRSARYAKKVFQKFVTKGVSVNTSFLLVEDTINSKVKRIAENVITEDGHPMFNPVHRNWIISDTYPDRNGIRTLYLYNFLNNYKKNLGYFKMIAEKPEINDREKHFLDIESSIIETIGYENLVFTRSGLHCDLHPRWDMRGEKISFDSIHEGTRQIYMVTLENLS